MGNVIMIGKKRRLFRLFIGMTLFFVILFVAYWFLFCDMSRLPQGELLAEYPSPTAQYTIKIYLCPGNATTVDSIRGELVEGNTKKNIYWEYKETSAHVYWASEYKVIINDVYLDIRYDTYDWRRGK